MILSTPLSTISFLLFFHSPDSESHVSASRCLCLEVTRTLYRNAVGEGIVEKVEERRVEHNVNEVRRTERERKRKRERERQRERQRERDRERDRERERQRGAVSSR